MSNSSDVHAGALVAKFLSWHNPNIIHNMLHMKVNLASTVFTENSFMEWYGLITVFFKFSDKNAGLLTKPFTVQCTSDTQSTKEQIS